MSCSNTAPQVSRVSTVPIHHLDALHLTEGQEVIGSCCKESTFGSRLSRVSFSDTVMDVPQLGCIADSQRNQLGEEHLMARVSEAH